MLGFWYLNYEYKWSIPDRVTQYYEYEKVFMFTHIDPMPNEDGEYTVHGRLLIADNQESASVYRVTVFYSQSEQKYILRAPRSVFLVYGSKLYELECKFHFEDKVHSDMTDRINSHNLEQYLQRLPEPTAIIEYVAAVDVYEVRPSSASYETVTKRKFTTAKIKPVKDGLRRANRKEFMTVYAWKFKFREVNH